LLVVLDLIPFQGQRVGLPRIAGPAWVIRVMLADSHPPTACTTVAVIRARLPSKSSDACTWRAMTANSWIRECTASAWDGSYPDMATRALLGRGEHRGDGRLSPVIT
jgi:hypothetical protein